MTRYLVPFMLVALTILGSTEALAQATRPGRVIRPARATQAKPLVRVENSQDALKPIQPESEEAPSIGPDETQRLKQIYDALSPDEQARMREFYEEQDVDLLALFAAAGGAEVQEAPLLPLIARKKFARTPKTVLAARTKLGLEDQDRPDDAAPPAAWAEWLHMNVMAGEWDSLHWFLEERAGDEAPGIYSHVIQSTNQGDPMLLPEEVLALANAAPGEPTNWQVDVLGQLLKRASARSSTGPMLAQLREGTRLYGGEVVENHARTAALLARAGMPEDAFTYLPDLEAAREQSDGRALLIHGIYHADRDEPLQAWELFGEVALLEEEDFALRQEALKEAVEWLPEVPEAQATAWLEQVFDSEQLAPAALEVIALDAMSLRQSKLSETERARAILVMKSAVDTLLDSGRVDSSAIKVPMRMLTTGLVAEAEAATTAKASRGGPPPGVAMLMRALPDESWLDSIEPSLAVRAYRAFIGVATRADEIDVALEILERGTSKHPEEAEEMGSEFLELWVKRLRPDQGSNQDAAMRSVFLMFGGRSSVAEAPLTRGRQARNLDRLVRVLALLEERGVDARGVDGVVEAFQACHSRSEAYTEEDIVRVLGPVEELPPETAARLAAAMQGGLSGDWRSREVQQRFGMRRNGMEIARVVEDGYALALRLVDRAREEEPGSWQHAVRKAALAYERLEHRKAQTDEELADYNTLRAECFLAFEDAARTYAEAAGRGEEKPSAAVFQAWFNTAIGASDLSDVTRDNILVEGSIRDEQVDRIRETIESMNQGMAEEHMGLLATGLVTAIDSLNPEVKPRVVRHALRIVGDHPNAAPLRRINALYEDLIQDEIHLRLTLDGQDTVGTEDPFGVVLSLRYTNAVDRETDGFEKYLQNRVWVYFGNRGTTMNYRDRLERSIRNAFADNFTIEGIGFFDSMHPSREVIEDGESGWQEKPLAYIVLEAADESVERIPPVRMDLDFVDQTGPVILAIESNAPPIDAAGTSDARPVHDLVVEQVLDTRDSDEAVLLEIRASGRGVLGGIDELLTGVEAPLEGYVIDASGIDEHEMNMLSGAEDEDDFFMRGAEDDTEYEDVDADGIYRQATERSWSVRYVPEATAATSGDAFMLPELVDDERGSLVSRAYSDMDLVTLDAPSHPLAGGLKNWAWLIALGIGVIVVIGLVYLVRVGSSSSDDGEDDFARLLPSRSSPLGTVHALARIDREYGERLPPERRVELKSTIGTLEEQYFSASTDRSEVELETLVRDWAREALAAR